MRALRFGERVFLDAETVRVLRGVNGDRVVFRHNDSRRYVARTFTDAEEWPGEPLPCEWERPGPEYELEPEGPETAVRLRRLVATVPEAGIWIGRAAKHEGFITKGTGESYLAGPGRRVMLEEVALPTERKARIVLAHRRDLRLVT